MPDERNRDWQNCEFLLYDTPAGNWNEALPLGNGSLGAMVFSGTHEERLAFNHDTLWAGRPEQKVNTELKEAFEPARKLIQEGKYSAATELLDSRLGNNTPAAYFPAGDVIIHTDLPGKVQSYSRSLDLRDACSRTEFQLENGLQISRECFISFPDQVFAMEYKASKPGNLNFTCHFSHQIPGMVSSSNVNSLLFEGGMPAQSLRHVIKWLDDEGRSGIRYAMQLSVFSSGGTVRNNNGIIQIIGADSAIIFVAIVSNFKDYKTAPEDSGIDCAAEAAAVISRAYQSGYHTLKKRHVEDYVRLYDRSVLHLSEADPDLLLTPERLYSSWKKETFSPALAALAYNFGRYLLISCSRPGTQAANLQGIWNDKLKPAWGSNYTININTEMNYWPAEVTNLAECAEPLFDLIFDAAEKGKIAAKKMYDLPGWCLHNCTDIWRFCANGSGQSRWALWPMGGAWFCRHLAEHIRYSNDPAFLEKAFPVLAEQAEFLIGRLVSINGKLTVCPSISPENGFIDPETKTSATVIYGAQMDLSIIREVLENVLEFSEKFPGKNETLIKKIPEILAQLQTPEIGSHGELLEFGIELEEEDILHRHLSHLYGAYPGNEFTPEKTPKLYQACIQSLLRRGDISHGWAMGWRAALWARFRNPGKFLTVMKHFFHPVDTPLDHWKGGGIYLNFLDAHPPFQIDGNFGITAALAEVFLQAHKKNENGVPLIELFPCLPPEWTDGELNGLRTSCGLTIDYLWKNGEASVEFKAARDVIFECRGQLFRLNSGEQKRITFTIA